MRIHIQRILVILVLSLSVILISILQSYDTPTLPSSSSLSSMPDHSQEPYINLYTDEETDHSLIFVNQAVKLKTPDHPEGQILLQLESDDIYFWRSDSTLLLAVPLKLTPTNGHAGAWYTFNLSTLGTRTTGQNPVKIKDFSPNPNKILTVTLSRSSDLFFIVEDHPNGYHQESWYDADSRQILPVRFELSPGNTEQQYSEQYRHNRPDATNGEMYFDKEKVYPLPDGSRVTTYADERGTIIHYQSEAYNLSVRYMDQQVINVGSITDVHGRNHPIIRVKDMQEYLSLPSMDYSAYLRSLPELMDEGWRMIDIYNYYKLGTAELELVQYEMHYERDYHNLTRYTYPLPIALVDAGQGLLQQASQDIEYSLSVYDLLDHRTRFEDNWMRKLPTQVTAIEEVELLPEWSDVNTHVLPAEIINLFMDRFPMPAEIDEVQANYTEECVLDCGDLGRVIQWRSIDGVWHIISDKGFYLVKDKQLVKLGELPITTASTIGEGVNQYTALDFIKLGKSWFVADTYGNRVLSLDEALQIEYEYPLPMPSKVRVGQDGSIEVDCLAGITVLTEQLVYVQNKPLPTTKLQSLALDETGLLFPKTSHYIDPQSKLHWVYNYSGEILLFDEVNKRYRNLYVGYPHNGRSMVRIIPYQNDVLVMLDHQLHRFSREGVWKETIAYPRSEPDGIYDRTPDGENSFILDKSEGVIYLVQGFRVLRIDLEENQATQLFEQHYSNIGKISLYKGHLIFSMEGHTTWYQEEITAHSNELIVISTESGKFSRYQLESGWVSDERSESGAGIVDESMKTGQLILHRVKDRNYSLAEYGVLDLDTLAFPMTAREVTRVTLSHGDQTQHIENRAMIQLLLSGLTGHDERPESSSSTPDMLDLVHIKLTSKNEIHEYAFDYTNNVLQRTSDEFIQMNDRFWMLVNQLLYPDSLLAQLYATQLQIEAQGQINEDVRRDGLLRPFEKSFIEDMEYNGWEKWLTRHTEGQRAIPYFSTLTEQMEAFRSNTDVVQWDLGIYFVTDRYSSTDGVKVGISKDEARQLLGNPAVENAYSWGYRTGDFVTFYLYFDKDRVKYVVFRMPL
jgi:hypothetical protein